MEPQCLTHAELLRKIQAIDPLLVKAIDEVDETLLFEFAKLSIEKRISWATGTANALNGFHKE